MRVYSVSEGDGPWVPLTALRTAELSDALDDAVAGNFEMVSAGRIEERIEQMRIILLAREMGWL